MREWLAPAPGNSFALEWASDFNQGLEWLARFSHDVALVNYRLGPRTGLELLAQVPEASYRLPIIFLTGLSEPDAGRKALEHGVFDCIEKDDLNPATLRRSIQYALQHFRTLRQLREKRSWFENLYHSTFEGILIHDGVRVLDANAAFTNMVGREHGEVIGAQLRQFFPPKSISLASQVTGDTAARRDLLLLGKRHRVMPTEARVRKIPYGGQLVYLVALRDLTERKRAEEELIRVNRELETRVAQRTAALERSNRDLEKFAETVAHDIRIPLQTVSVYLQDLRANGQEQPDPLGVHFVGRAIEMVDRIRDLVCAVLAYSRISATCPPKRKVELKYLVKDVLAEMDDEVQRSGADIQVGPLPSIEGDRAMLADLFRNLLHNALKYCRTEDSRVELSARKEETHWLFTLRDNGIGFDPADAEEIFSMFYRAGNAAGRPGVGIGLASCRKIVQLHGGRIWATSEPGNGSEFCFTLPAGE